MAINKETKSFGMPWEKEYGYSQAVKVGDTIYLSGQVSHDDKGDIVGLRDMEAQMRQAYTNIQKLLAQYGATMDNVVDEVLFVTDMDSLRSSGQMQIRSLFRQSCCGKHHCTNSASCVSS